MIVKQTSLKGTVKNLIKEPISKYYEKAYGMKFSEIKKVFNHGNTPIERNQLFREALRKQLQKYSDKHSYAYTPVFLDHKLHIYDIIVLSYSTYGQEIIKEYDVQAVQRPRTSYREKRAAGIRSIFHN